MRYLTIILLFFSLSVNAQLVATASGGPSTQGEDDDGWVSPTGKEDDEWTDSEKMYDGSLLTYGWTSTNGNHVTLTRAAVSCSKVRVYAGRAAGGQADLIIEVYYGAAFHEIHNGVVTEDTWQEIAIGSTETVTKAKITVGDGIESQVIEFEFESL